QRRVALPRSDQPVAVGCLAHLVSGGHQGVLLWAAEVDFKIGAGGETVLPRRVPTEALAKIVARAHLAHHALPRVAELQRLALARFRQLGERHGNIFAVGWDSVLRFAG